MTSPGSASGRSGTSRTSASCLSPRRACPATSRSRTAGGVPPRPAECCLDVASADRARARHDSDRRAGAARHHHVWRVRGDEAAGIPARALLRGFQIRQLRRPLPPTAVARPRPPDRGASAPRTPRCSVRARSAQHLWMRWYPPNNDPEDDPDYTSLPQVGGLERALDRLQRTYGSRSASRFTTRNSATSHPRRPSSLPFAGDRRPVPQLGRVHLLARLPGRELCPVSAARSGADQDGRRRLGHGALDDPRRREADLQRLAAPPVLPATSASRRRNLELWGCVRPARFAILDTGQPQTARIQFKRGTRAPWTTLRTVTISNASNCYFDVHLRLPGSGTVRLSYTYPANDPLLTPNDGTAYSRSVRVTLTSL